MGYKKSTTCRIELSRGCFAVVDEKDFRRLNKHKWYCSTLGYAVREKRNGSSRKTIWMHRVVLQVQDGVSVDHINHNKLDNRSSNLRPCRYSENLCNTPKRKTNTTGYKGVTFDRRWSRYRAQITKNRKYYHLGMFDTAKEAHSAYLAKARELHGDFACG